MRTDSPKGSLVSKSKLSDRTVISVCSANIPAFLETGDRTGSTWDYVISATSRMTF